jgi:hypothetical protein
VEHDHFVIDHSLIFNYVGRRYAIYGENFIAGLQSDGVRRRTHADRRNNRARHAVQPTQIV